MRAWTKNKIDWEFREKILSEKLKNNDKTLRQKDFLEAKLISVYLLLNTGQIEGYKGLDEFAKKYNLKYISRGKYDSKEKLDEYFIKNIAKNCKDSIMPIQKELNNMGFSSWYQALATGFYGYKGLSDFCNKNGLKMNRSFFDVTESEKFINEKIIPLSKNGYFPSESHVKNLFPTFHEALIKRRIKPYTSYSNLARSKGFKVSKPKNDFSTKERFMDYYEKVITKLITPDRVLPFNDLKRHSGWYRILQDGKVEGFTNFKDFKSKMNLK